MLKRMCRDDRTALDALDKATAIPAGSNQYSERVDNIHTLSSHDAGRLRRKSVTHHFSTLPRAFGLHGKRGSIAIMTVGDTIIAYLGEGDIRTHTVTAQAIEHHEDEWHVLDDLTSASSLQVKLVENPDASRIVIICDAHPPDDYALDYAWHIDATEDSGWGQFRDLPSVSESRLPPSMEESIEQTVEDMAELANNTDPMDAVQHIDNEDLIVELEAVPRWIESLMHALSVRLVQKTSPEAREHLPAAQIAYLLDRRPIEDEDSI